MNELTKAGGVALAVRELVKSMVPGKLLESLDEYEAVCELASALDGLKVMFRDEQLRRLKAEGEKVSEKGTLSLTLRSGWILEARPRSTQLDTRKVEVFLRARGQQPEQLMDTTVTYKVSTHKVDAAVARGELTEKEVESLRTELVYSVQPPRRVRQDEGEAVIGYEE